MVKAAIEGLRTKIIAVTLVVGLAPMLILGAVVYGRFSNLCRARTMEHTAHVARIQAEIIDTTLRERASALQAVLGVSEPARLMTSGFLDGMVETLNRTTSHPGLLTLALLDDRGRILTVSARGEAVGADREAVQRPATRASVYGRGVDDVFLSENGAPRFFLTVRGEGAAKGVFLRACFDGEMLRHPFHRARVDPVQDIYLLDRNGVFQTRPWYDGDLLRASALRMAAFSEGDTTVQRTVRDGIASFSAGAWLTEADWLLVVRQASCEQHGRLAAARNAAILSVAMGFAAVLLVAVALTHFMVGRLRKATRDASDLSVQVAQNEKLAVIGKMAAGVAHEINNPLAIIDVKVGLIKDFFAQNASGDSEARHRFAAAVEAIEKAVARASKITRNLLAYASRLEPRRDEVNVNRALNSTIDMLEQHARLHRIGIQTDLQEDLPEVAGNESRLQQVFLNLLNNALDAIGSDGLIEVTSRQTGNDVLVEISDDGPGMDPEMQKHLFEPFFSTKDAVYGTGLGLAISHGIVTNMNGAIRVVSTPGEGTTVAVILPAAFAGAPLNP